MHSPENHIIQKEVYEHILPFDLLPEVTFDQNLFLSTSLIGRTD